MQITIRYYDRQLIAQTTFLTDLVNCITYSFLPPRGIFFIDVSNCTCCILMTIEISTLQHREMLHRRIRICDVCWSLRCRAPQLGYEDIIQKYNKSISIPLQNSLFHRKRNILHRCFKLHLLHLDDDRDLHVAAPRDVTPENSIL